MVRKLAIVWVTVIIWVSGCGESGSSIKPVARRIDTPAGMIGYLQRRNLPALKSVEVWENKYGPGLKITTAHYEVLTTLLEPLMLSQVPGFMESAYRGYNTQLPEPVETTTRFTIYLFAERKQWEDFTLDFAGRRRAPMYYKIKAGAYYLNGSCVAYNIGRERTFSVLGHEGWHQFNKRYFRYRLPSWLDEGIATLFEASGERRGLFYFEPGRNGSRLGALKQTLLKNKMIPLEELIAINPGEAIFSGDEAVTAFYGQCYALVRFLREEDYGKRLANYHQMMLGGLKGKWPISPRNQRIAADRNIPLTTRWNRTVATQLFGHYITGDSGVSAIEEEYLRFCRKIVYRIRLQVETKNTTLKTRN